MKNSGPEEGPRIIYLVLMACSPCPQKEEILLEMCPCYWQEPLGRPLPGCEAGSESLSQLPQKSQGLRNTTDPTARRARTHMALSTCVRKRSHWLANDYPKCQSQQEACPLPEGIQHLGLTIVTHKAVWKEEEIHDFIIQINKCYQANVTFPFQLLFQCTERQGQSTDSNACIVEKSFKVKGKETQKVRGVTHRAENCQKTYPIQCKVRKHLCIQPLGSDLQSNLPNV